LEKDEDDDVADEDDGDGDEDAFKPWSPSPDSLRSFSLRSNGVRSFVFQK
jgi:hypothetical protein